MKAIIVCTAGAYIGPKDGEIWACTTAFRKPTHQKNIDRLYFMDPLKEFVENFPDFVSEVNALDCDVYCLKHYPEIPRSRAFPLKEVVGTLGYAYFTSSLAYMMAHAIYEGKDLHLHKINTIFSSREYLHQKDCHEFWCGYAIGKGLRVQLDPESFLLKPQPWCAPIYGYTKRKYEDVANKCIRSKLEEVSRIRGEVTRTEGNIDDIAIHL